MSSTGEPKQSRWQQTLEKGKDVFRGVGIVFRTGSFLIILVGNIISVIIGLGLGYKIMYLQVCAQPSWACRAQKRAEAYALPYDSKRVWRCFP